MYFDSFSAALHMDGHGMYVWTAYLIAAVVISMVLIVPKRREKLFLQRLQGTLRQQESQARQRGENY